MKGNIDKFELSVNEEIYVEGEDLFDKGAVLAIKKSENNLYTSEIVDGDEVIEVEILNPASLQRKTTCDCEMFQKHKLCKHIVATLLAIRKKLSKPKSKRKTSRKEEKKFTTRSLLNVIANQELKSFVQDYAKKDKKFELYFKARFSKKMELDDNKLKYKSILDALIPLAKNSEYKINKTSIYQVNKFFNEFYHQIHDSLVLQQYAEAFDIYAPVFKKIAYVRHYARVEESGIDDIDKKYHHLLIKLLASKAAPELRDHIKSYALTLASFSYYQIRDFQDNILMITYNYDNSSLFEIQSVISEHYLRENSPLLLALFFFFNQDTLEKFEYSKYYYNQQSLIRALHILLKQNCTAISKNILQQIDVLGWKNSSFDELRLIILKQEKNYQGFIEYAMEKLIGSGQFYYFKLMHSGIPENKRNLLIEAIDQNKDKISSDLLCKIYQFNNDTKNLLDTIIQKDDVFLAMEYDTSLFDQYPDETGEFYLSSVEDYLLNHVGYEANKYVNNIIQHLSNRGNKSLAKKIKQLIIQKFPHRKRFLSSYQ